MEIESTLIEAHVFRKSGNDIEFLLLKRSDEDELYPGSWQMVSGSIDENEKAYVAALREIKEETGLIPLKFWVVPNVNSFYNQVKGKIIMIPVFAALVERSSKVILSNEHSEFKWKKKEEAKKMLLWKGQRNSVDIVHEYFLNELSTLDLVEIKVNQL
jgi:dATP pyrophosphohydrolase